MANAAPAPSIEPTPDGPYRVTGIADLRNSRDEPIPSDAVIYLCRCGGSGNKPFCDGTHKRNGFSGARLSDVSTVRTDDYAGRELVIHDNRSVCAHIGFCTEHSPDVFALGKEPWIDPDGGPAEKTIATVRMCPSGALSYTLNGILHRDQPRTPCIRVMKDGPYFVMGGPELKAGERPLSPEHYTLCRCGASKSKPFCDGSHWQVGFSDDDRPAQADDRRLKWAVSLIAAVMLAGTIALLQWIDAAKLAGSPGYYGPGPLIADINLTLQVLLLAGLTMGYRLARAGNIAAHRYNQTVWVLLSAVLVIFMMAASLQDVWPEQASDMAAPRYWVTWLHAGLGSIAVSGGIYLLLQLNDLLPRALRVDGWKRLMRLTLAAYWGVALLGFLTYYYWYIA